MAGFEKQLKVTRSGSPPGAEDQTWIRRDELAALQRDRQTLAALRREALRLRLDVLFLQADLDRCRHELELWRGW